MKSIVIVIQINFSKLMTDISAFCMRMFVTKTQRLIFTVIIFPCAMNIFQFVMQDLILRKKKFVPGEEEILREFFIVDEDYLEEMRMCTTKDIGSNNVLKSMQDMAKDIEGDINDEHEKDLQVSNVGFGKGELDKSNFGSSKETGDNSLVDEDNIEV